VREVAEETGFRAVLGRVLGQVRYPLAVPDGGTVLKSVVYFSARAVAGDFQPNSEVDQLRWLAPERAAGELSYPQDREVLAAFTALPAATRTLLLVRHAKALSRTEWDGPDEQRPLSHAGHKQAEALRRLLPLFGADRVHAAPRTRCVQTVLPLAEELGTRVIEEPLLTEEVYWKRPESGLTRLLEIAAKPGTPVVCSQGGVIPDIVGRLAEEGNLGLRHIESKKGSTWVLSFAQDERDGTGPLDPVRSEDAGPRLVAADYWPDPLA
jgi:8-oxo-dGTP diphosphatase